MNECFQCADYRDLIVKIFFKRVTRCLHFCKCVVMKEGRIRSREMKRKGERRKRLREKRKEKGREGERGIKEGERERERERGGNGK